MNCSIIISVNEVRLEALKHLPNLLKRLHQDIGGARAQPPSLVAVIVEVLLLKDSFKQNLSSSLLYPHLRQV